MASDMIGIDMGLKLGLREMVSHLPFLMFFFDIDRELLTNSLPAVDLTLAADVIY
jgi:hypothetical protein